MTKARKRKEEVRTVAEALGKIRVLAVGVSTQKKGSNFALLRQCAHDARAVTHRFETKRELEGHPDGIRLLVSGGDPKPTRSEIISALRDLATEASENERILFFFSGHGHRIADALYLLPEDAWTDDNPTALVAYDDVVKILSNSRGKVKIVVLDACVSGPDTTHLKHPAAKLSEKFLSEYIQKSGGVAVLASSLSDQPSSTKSPDPKLSLFTHFFAAALAGEAEALDGDLLSIESLYKWVSVKVEQVSKSHHRPQQPALHLTQKGTIFLGDFRHPATPPALALQSAPLLDVAFEDDAPLKPRDILPDIADWSTPSVDDIQKWVNNELRSHYEEHLGRLRAALRTRLNFAGDAIALSKRYAEISFPDGLLTLNYVPTGKKSGWLRKRVSFALPVWAGKNDDLLRVLDALGVQPTRVSLTLSEGVSPLATIPAAERHGWTILSELDEKVEAKAATGHRVTIIRHVITIDGFRPGELVDGDVPLADIAVVCEVLSLLGQPHRGVRAATPDAAALSGDKPASSSVVGTFVPPTQRAVRVATSGNENYIVKTEVLAESRGRFPDRARVVSVVVLGHGRGVLSVAGGPTIGVEDVFAHSVEEVIEQLERSVPYRFEGHQVGHRDGNLVYERDGVTHPVPFPYGA